MQAAYAEAATSGRGVLTCKNDGCLSPRFIGCSARQSHMFSCQGEVKNSVLVDVN